eukprot:TRINITY_DN239_c0_g1_i6.p1 TRINITY_DN239_c0_g1~~TRINITY_DN239_c0_g1_i6.p1  ORF type:complete len:452 (+),score=211.91 TRINITY_DN239_c0_g1_i6:75-1430(+)
MSELKKRVCLITSGSRGDIEPFAILAANLQRSSHLQVTLVGSGDHVEFVKRFGVLNFIPFTERADVKMNQVGTLLINESDFTKLMTVFQEIFENEFPITTQEIYNILKDQDIVLYNVNVESSVLIACLKLNTIKISLHLVPFVKATNIPPPIVDESKLSNIDDWTQVWEGLLNGIWSANKSTINKFLREKFSMQELEEPLHSINNNNIQYSQIKKVMCFSENVVKRGDQWNENVIYAGYIFMKSIENQLNWQPSKQLEEFLSYQNQNQNQNQNNQAIVYFGFGSMPHSNPSHLLDIVLDTISNLSIRAVICEGWFTLHKPSNWDQIYASRFNDHQIIFVRDVPHNWLLNRCSLNVIHGGAGTTAASLRSGKPTLVCPFFLDQPFWAHRVYEIGVGPKPNFNANTITVEQLSISINQILQSDEIKQKAEQLAIKLRQEDASTKILEIINNLI